MINWLLAVFVFFSLIEQAVAAPELYSCQFKNIETKKSEAAAVGAITTKNFTYDPSSGRAIQVGVDEDVIVVSGTETISFFMKENNGSVDLITIWKNSEVNNKMSAIMSAHKSGAKASSYQTHGFCGLMQRG